MTADVVMRIESLHVRYSNRAHAVREVSLSVRRSTTHVLVGESGCGKTSIANAVLGMLPPRTIVTGSITVSLDPHGTSTELVGLAPREMRSLRGIAVGYVAQDPFRHFDPLRTVRHHVESAWRVHGQRPPLGAVDRLLTDLGIDDANARSRQRPHEWSGGMLQRATIAAATALGPSLLVADEPTSALDAALARSTIAEFRRHDRSTLLITHDLSLAEDLADDITVLYGGEVVEQGPAAIILASPRHPYTKALAASIPRGRTLPSPLPGAPPRPDRPSVACSFVERCPLATDVCGERRPPLVNGVACHEANTA